MLLTARRAVLASIASVVVLAGCVGDESPKFKAIENLDVIAYLPPGVEVGSDRANLDLHGAGVDVSHGVASPDQV